jgi:hypothetical protein
MGGGEGRNKKDDRKKAWVSSVSLVYSLSRVWIVALTFSPGLYVMKLIYFDTVFMTVWMGVQGILCLLLTGQGSSALVVARHICKSVSLENSQQTSIATVRYHLRTLATFPTPLIFHWSLPLMTTYRMNLNWSCSISLDRSFKHTPGQPQHFS